MFLNLHFVCLFFQAFQISQQLWNGLQDLDITMKDLRVQAVVGRGSFGVVKLEYHRKEQRRVYALKCVGKKQV